MSYFKMVSLARTPEDNKLNDSVPMVAGSSSPKYGYGTCISLDETDLKKLKMDGELPDVGDMLHFMAMAKVTSVSEHERATDNGTEKCCRIELQITDMGVENENREGDEEEKQEQRAKTRYGKDDGENEEEEAA